MRLMITGPQGSGKTTQVKSISDKLGLCIVKVGDLLRERALEQDPLGQKLHQDISEGILTDNKVVADILREELSKPKCAPGFIADGYPRSIEQLGEFDPKYDLVIYLDLTLEEAEKRLLKRGREDDTPEVIKQRFETFEEKTQKVVDYYQAQGILHKVDGNQEEQKVTADIMSVIKNYAKPKN